MNGIEPKSAKKSFAILPLDDSREFAVIKSRTYRKPSNIERKLNNENVLGNFSSSSSWLVKNNLLYLPNKKHD